MVEITSNVSSDDPKSVVDLHHSRGLTLILLSWESTAGNGQISLIAELEDELKDSREQLDRASSLLARTHISQGVLNVHHLSSLVDIVWPDENVRLLLDAELSDTSLLSALVRVLKLPTARSDVIELIRVLRAREADKKMLEDSVAMLEERLHQSAIKQDETNARIERLNNDLATARCDVVERDRLLVGKADVERRLEDHLSQAQSEIERLLATAHEEVATLENLTSSKAAVEKRLEDALARTVEKEAAIEKLTGELAQRTTDLETAQKAIDTRPVRSADDSSVITTLKNEVGSLREQLNRANALNSLTGGARNVPPSPTFAPALRLGGGDLPNGAPVNGSGGSHGLAAVSGGPAGWRNQRRHSSAGAFSLAAADPRSSVDETMMTHKRHQFANPLVVSVAYNSDEGARFRTPSGLDRYEEDPAEEKIRLLLDGKALDEDVLEGLVKGLKIPAASTTNPPNIKEILFPANLISLVTNEMWKYGLIQESERFLAAIMQTIQAHVVVGEFTSERGVH
jgi:myosin-5